MFWAAVAGTVSATPVPAIATAAAATTPRRAHLPTTDSMPFTPRVSTPQPCLPRTSAMLAGQALTRKGEPSPGGDLSPGSAGRASPQRGRDVEEQRDAAPGLGGIRAGGLAQPLDDETRVGEGLGVGLERPVLAVERHGQ